MSSNDSAEHVLSAERVSKLQEESAQLMRRGVDALAGFYSAWWDSGQGPARENSGIFAQAWSDLLANCFRGMTDAFFSNRKMVENPLTWEALFNGWKRFLGAAPPQAFFTTPEMGFTLAHLKSWQENQARLFSAWIDCQERIAEFYKPGGEGEKQIDSCAKSSEALAAEWRNFTVSQARDFLDFLESLRGNKAGVEGR